VTISINDEIQDLTEVSTLQDLVTSLQLSEKTGIAIALNETVVTRSAWSTCELTESDRVTIIQATQGG